MIRLISACCLILLVACSQTRETSSAASTGGAAATDAAAGEATIRTSDSAWFANHNAGNADAVAALYADDAVINAPGAPPARGSAAIRQFFAKDVADMKAGNLTMTPSPTAEIGVSGDLGWIWNTFTVKDKAGKTVDAGKYVTVHARKDGKWAIIRDIWNSDNPSTPPPTAATAN